MSPVKTPRINHGEASAVTLTAQLQSFLLPRLHVCISLNVTELKCPREARASLKQTGPYLPVLMYLMRLKGHWRSGTMNATSPHSAQAPYNMSGMARGPRSHLSLIASAGSRE